MDKEKFEEILYYGLSKYIKNQLKNIPEKYKRGLKYILKNPEKFFKNYIYIEKIKNNIFEEKNITENEFIEVLNFLEQIKKEKKFIEKNLSKNIILNNINYFFKYKNNEILGNPFGIKILDKNIGGIFGLTALTGAPGLGKTTLATQITLYNIYNLYPVLYISLEISKDLLITKLAAQKTKIPFKKVLNESLDYNIAKKFYQNLLELYNMNNFYIIDKTDNVNFEIIEKYIRYLNYNYNNEILIVLDHLYLFNEFNDKNLTYNERIGKIITRFMELKNKYKVNFLIITPKNKQGYKIPELSSIKGTNDLEYAFETIFSIENLEEDNNEGNVSIYIIKNRWGETKQIPLNFNKKEQYFYELS